MARLLVPQTGNGGFDSPQGHQNGPYCVGYRNYNGPKVANPGDRLSESTDDLSKIHVCVNGAGAIPRIGRRRRELSCPSAPDPRMGRDVANVDGVWFESYRWHDIWV